MSDEEYAGKIAELDHILNDCDVPLKPDLVWRLLDEIACHVLLTGIAFDD